ncbi:LysM domain-containing protein [Lachnospiraceae bacterium XBB1006]|nr:LysM domain-containing protein [Lachnospiraceae bacterium XBB1006]
MSNTVRNNHTSSRSIQRKPTAHKNIGYCFLIIVICLFIAILTHKLMAQPEQAHASDGGTTVYKSIVIKEQDSLWSLAKEYGRGNFGGTKHYIAMLRKVNHLENNTIHAGESIIVPIHISSVH